MSSFKINHIIWLFTLAFMVGGCSKNSAEESFLEKYYRTAAKGDAQELSEYHDYRMFKATTMSDRQMVMWMTQNLMNEMDKLSNANGELKKVSIRKKEEFKEGTEIILLVTCDLEFKNGRTITQKQALSRPDGKLKIFLVKPESGQW